MDATRNLIDYAMDNNGVEFRNELYASIHDRVTAAIEAKKQEIAGNLVRQESAAHPDEAEDKKLIDKEIKKKMKAEEHSDEAEDKKMIDKEIKKKMKTEESDEEKGENAEKHEERPKKPNAFTMKSKGPSEFAKSSSGGKTKETSTGRTHSSGDRY
jgi:hypothetical protein